MNCSPIDTPTPRAQSPGTGQRHNRRGLTLVEVAIAMVMLAVMLGGILQSFIMVRRNAEAAIRQNCATNAVQGYIEQIRTALSNVDINNIPFSPASGTPTDGVAAYNLGTVRLVRNTGATPDDLYVSAGTPPNPASLAPGEIPVGATTNLKKIPIVETSTSGTPTALNTMDLRLWIWLENKSVPANAVYGQTRALTIIYSWEFRDGARVRKYTSSLRTMMSAVRTL